MQCVQQQGRNSHQTSSKIVGLVVDISLGASQNSWTNLVPSEFSFWLLLIKWIVIVCIAWNYQYNASDQFQKRRISIVLHLAPSFHSSGGTTCFWNRAKENSSFLEAATIFPLRSQRMKERPVIFLMVKRLITSKAVTKTFDSWQIQSASVNI